MSSAIRNFLVMFFLFLLIFGICGHFFITELVPGFISANDNTSEAESNTADAESVVSNPSNGTADSEQEISGATYTFAFLCLGLDNELMHVYLVRVNDGYKTCVSASIPAYSTTETGGSTLEEIYRFKGRDFLIRKLQYLTGYAIDDYATLYSADYHKNSHTVVTLSNRLEYRFRVNEAFEYPDPNYEDYEEPTLEEGSEESMEEETSFEPAVPGEYFTVEPNSYALHGITNGLTNYLILLDSEWNPNAHEIYEELFKRIFDDRKIKDDVSMQNTVMNYMEDKSFSDYTSSTASKYLFKYNNQHFEYECHRISDWDDLKNTFIAKEKGNS